MVKKRFLKIEDVGGIEFNPNSSRFECVLLAVKVASKIYEEEKNVGEVKKEKLIERPNVEEDEEPVAGRAGTGAWIRAGAITKKAKGKKKMRKTTTTNKKGQKAEPPPDMPQELKDYIRSHLNGSDFRLLIQKYLHKTDLSQRHNRLSVPAKKVMTDFLTDDEKAFFNKTEKDHKSKATKLKGIKVKLLEPKGEECELPFKRWTLGKADPKNNSFTYVFIDKWSEICKRNELKEGMILQVWSFRRAGVELSFAFVVVNDGGGQKEGGSDITS